jgi:hypothetical protein
VVAVDDERVDGDLRGPEDEGERVEPQDGETDRHLSPGAAGRRVRARQNGQDDAVPRITEQPSEPDRGRSRRGMTGEDVFGVRLGAVLADQRENSGQVRGTRSARHHTGPRTGS